MLTASGNSSLSTATATLPAARVRIHELDGLRGLLALFVVCCHLSFPLESLRPVLATWLPFLEVGWWYAVDVFFVMSGFVMLHVYGRVFAGAWRRADYWQFMKVRVARLYPVHLAAMLLLLLGVSPFIFHSPQLTGPDGRYSWSGFWAALFMLHSPWIAQRTWNYPGWSISAEWHAYVIFPFVAGWVQALRRQLAWALMMVGVLVPFTLYLCDLQPDQYPTNGWLVLLRVLPLFLCGMALYTVRRDGAGMARAPALLIAGLTVFCLCYAPAAPYAVLLVPLLVLAVLADDWVGRVFRSVPLLWLGKISYSLYMTHALVEIFLMRMAGKLGERWLGAGWLDAPAAAAAMWISAIIVALLLGQLTWRFVEVPGRRLILGR